jgi:hypothetical protein
MQAITTKYLGPTNSRGSRIKATACGTSVTISYDHSLSAEEAHKAAAIALCTNFGWGNYGNLISGSIENGFVFLFEPKTVWSMRRALGNLVQYAVGNRGSRDGNPYSKTEVKRALEALAYDVSGSYPDETPLDAADSYKTWSHE